MQLLWHFEALVLPKNCERPVVLQINLNYTPRVDELARRPPTLMHSSPQPFCKIRSAFTIASCHDLAGSVLSSQAVDKKMQSHAKSSKPKSMTYQTTTTTNVANYMRKVWRLQCYPGLVDYSNLVRGMFSTNENILTYTVYLPPLAQVTFHSSMTRKSLGTICTAIGNDAAYNTLLAVINNYD